MKVYSNVIDAKGLQENERRAYEARNKKTESSIELYELQVEEGKIQETRPKSKKRKVKV